MELANAITAFFESLPSKSPDNMVKYKGLHSLFWKFTPWKTCSFDLQVSNFEGNGE